MKIFKLPLFTATKIGVVSLIAGAALSNVAFAQNQAADYPKNPIKLIVPFPAGGGTDMIARTLAQKVTEQNGWNIVVENKPGAGGNIGVDAAAKSPADGYTIVMGQTSNLAVAPSLYKKLPYNPAQDFKPVALVASSPVLLVSNAGAEMNSFAKLLEKARQNPEGVTVGYAGNGTVAHLAVTQIEKAAGIKLQHIPYKGVAQAMTDLGGGNIDIFVGSIPSLLGHIRNQKVQPLAVTSAKRSGQLPNTPTVAEGAGVAGFDAVTWFGVLAPAQTPDAVIDKLNAAINAALKDKATADKLRSEGGEVLGGTAAEFEKLLAAEIPHWAGVVRDAGVQLQ